VKYVPAHVYMSVMDWLFPERVGKKYKAKYCVPVNAQYVLDIDAYTRQKYNWFHFCENKTCLDCLGLAKRLKRARTHTYGKDDTTVRDFFSVNLIETS
jgi:hypothetical protein